MNTFNESKLPPITYPRQVSPIKLVNTENNKTSRKTLINGETIELISPIKQDSSFINDQSSGRLNSSFLSSLHLISSNSCLPALAVNKSTDAIKQNIRNSFLLTEKNKKLVIENKKKRQELFKNLSKETRIVIQTEKQEKILKMINRKFKKTENEKNRQEKIVFAQVLITFVSVFGFCWKIKQDFDRVVEYRRMIHKYLFSVAVVCKALGKFFRSLGRVKRLISFRKLRRIMPRFIRRFKHWMYETYSFRILAVIDNYTKHGSIARVNYIINFQIKLIQRSIRDFICVMKHRKFALRLIWNKVDKGEKVFETIQHYYISNYLKEKLKSHLNNRKKLSKLNTFLTSEFSQSIDLYEIFGNDDLNPSTLRLYKKKSLKKLITKAKSEKPFWRQIRFPRFPLITTLKDEFTSSINSILKKKRVSYPRKVTFK